MINPIPFQFRGLIDPTKKFMYAEISKNASSKIKLTLSKEGWTSLTSIAYEDTKSFFEDKRIFCVLRDPYQRYLTGFVNYLTGPDAVEYNKSIRYNLQNLLKFNTKSNFDILRLAFDSGKFEFDIHTQLQIKSLDNLDMNNIDFFYLNDNLGFQLNKYFQKHNIFISFNNIKINTRTDGRLYGNFYQSLVTEFFEKEEHILFKENLLNYLKPDYDLIESTTFYDI